MKYIMPNSIVLSKYEARDFILDQTLQTRHRHHRMDPKMRRSALSQSRAHTQCCFKNEKIVHSTWVSLHWPLMLPKNIIRYPNPKFKYIALILQLFRTLCAVKYWMKLRSRWQIINATRETRKIKTAETRHKTFYREYHYKLVCHVLMWNPVMEICT